ncbi:Translation Initiation Factor 5B [Cichlidogyrus casuarinus]|uniref:Eukaryotic translation initiation factor 5B n=1 Tax=Cichlidogyrus casuarinus TaxID=1844966 RepID=A0ABD2Q372_9PLAT
MADNDNLPKGEAEVEKSKNAKKKSKAKNTASKPVEQPAVEKKPKGYSKVKAEIEKRKADEEKARKQQEEEERKYEEELRLRQEQEAKEKREKEQRLLERKEHKDALRAQGLLLTAKQKENQRKVQEMLAARGVVVNEEKEKKPSGTARGKKFKKGKPLEPQQQQQQNDHVAEEEKKESSELADWEDLADDLEEETCTQPTQEVKNGTASFVPVKPKFALIHDTLTDDEKASLIATARSNIKERHKLYEAQRSTDRLRSGVICVLGHVDTGKTKILDKLRNTNVQDREAGGITQQIGATNVPKQNICDATAMCSKFFDTSNMKLPGLLIIDTPGHESFSNLRIRGSSLCDMAILVVDLMHSLEEQTKESIRILAARKTPFVVALNKIDRLYNWKSSPKESVVQVIARQAPETMNDMNDRVKKVISDFACLELNARLFYEAEHGGIRETDSSYVNMVPTSAHSGDGMGDLLAYICRNLEENLGTRISYSDELSASVMEVKEIDGLGTTIDTIVVNGTLHQGDQIVLAGQDGPFSTQIRSLLQPAPMSEFRVKASNYQQLKQLVGAQGVKIAAKNLEQCLAGLPVYVAHDLSEELYYKKKLERLIDDALKAIQVSSLGVYVMASTLGSLESLLVYLTDTDIPYSGINIGTVHKKDVIKASVMLKRDPKWAIILAFDVKVDKEARKLADEMNVKIFTSEIIYQLQDQMQKYFEELKNQNRVKHRDQAVFPVRLKILPDMVFHKRAPIVMGVRVEAGILKVGTPLCVPSKECVQIGKVFSIETNNKPMDSARAGSEVCIRVDPLEGETPKLFGRHFDLQDEVVSKVKLSSTMHSFLPQITRLSIDVMKDYFRDDLSKDDWRLMAELKKLLNIP